MPGDKNKRNLAQPMATTIVGEQTGPVQVGADGRKFVLSMYNTPNVNKGDTVMVNSSMPIKDGYVIGGDYKAVVKPKMAPMGIKIKAQLPKKKD